MNTSKTQVKYLLLEDQSEDFKEFNKTIKAIIKELDYVPTNVMPRHQVVSDFIKAFENRSIGQGDTFENLTKSLLNPVLTQEDNVIFFVDVQWNNNNRAGLDFVNTYLLKLFPETQNKIIFLTVKSFGKEFNGQNHIDKNKIRANNKSELNDLQSYIQKALNIGTNSGEKTREPKIDV